MVAILEDRKIEKSVEENVLPGGNENCERRFIEMDNKAMLYLFMKGIQELNLGRSYEVLTPGYGSMYIGPFAKVMCGYDFLTPLNYGGHKLYEHAVNALNAGGTEYIEYLNSKGYRMNERYTDIVGNLLRGITWAGKANLRLIESDKMQDGNQERFEVLPQYSNGLFRIENSNARRMIQFMYESSRELLDRDIDKKEYIDRD